MRKLYFLKTMLLLCALVAGSASAWADDPITLVSGSGTSGYVVPINWTSSGTVEGGSYLKFDNGTITSPQFAPHTSLSFTYSVATFGSGTNHPLTIRVLNASTNAVITEKKTSTPTSSSYISTDSPLSLGDVDVDFKIQLYAPTGKGVRLRNYSITGIPSVTKYSLTFTNPIGGTITVTKGETAVASGDKFAKDDVLGIVATPATGYDFTSWTAEGATLGSSTSATTTLTMPAAAVALSATFTPQDIESDVILDDAIENGSISANKATANVGETVTLTATPASGYVTGEWTVLDDNAEEVTVTKTGDNTATFTMPATDVYVSATFLAVHTVTYYVGGVSNTVNRIHGTTLNLDDASAIGGMAFAGWSSARNAASPVFVENTTIVNNDMTLYAVFVAKAGASSYNLVEAAQSDWRGDYLIAYNSTTFANGSVGGTDGLGKQNTSKNPGDNLSGKIVNSTWGDNYNVTIVAINNNDLSKGYMMKTKDGKYNYQTSNANGLSATDNAATATSHPLTITYNSSLNIAISISAGAVFHYNSSGYFRFYKDGSQDAVYLYKKVTSTPIYTLAEPETVTITTAGLATYASDVPLDYSSVSGIEAYIAKEESDKIKLYKVNKVPAETGVLLRATSSLSVDTEFSVPVATTTDDVTGNKFVRGEGKAVATGTSSPYNYILNNVGGVVGFYRANGQMVATNRAYLSTSVTADARISLNFEDETASINEKDAVNGEDYSAAVYDLQGRRVNTTLVNSEKRIVNSGSLKKGLYIVNGKKVLVK